MTKHRRISNAVAGLLLLGGLAYYAYAYATAESRVRALCVEIEPGLSLSELRSFSSEHGLGPQPHETGVSFLVERKTFGRYGCRVTIEAGVVSESKYNFAS
jgi:hypothetical protein